MDPFTSIGDSMFSCRNCRNPVVFRRDLLSKNFLAKTGQAYMFSHAINVVLGKKEDKKLMTGNFAVSDVYCGNCGETLGWKYVIAYVQRQKYKEGNFVIEKAKILKEYC